MSVPWWWNQADVSMLLIGYAARREWLYSFGPWYKKEWVWVVEQIWAIENGFVKRPSRSRS